MTRTRKSRTSRATNWTKLLDESPYGWVVEDFALGKFSMRQACDHLRFTAIAGDFRNLVRNGGTDRARRLARKALKRRGLLGV